MDVPGPVREAMERTFGLDRSRYRIVTLKGDASSRSYHRVETVDRSASTVVVMELAADPLASDEFTQWDPPEYPFTLVQRYLAAGGLPVPAILGADPGRGWLVLEDLGDDTLERVLLATPREDWTPWYEMAVDLIARWQRHARETTDRNPVSARVFSRRLLEWELEHWVEWGIEARLGIELDAGQRGALGEAWQGLLDALGEIPRVLVHRDWQSRNLMVRGVPGDPSLWIIDFQDALTGPVVYDAVALLADSYVEIDGELQDAMIERLLGQLDPDGDVGTWKRWFDLQAVQRKLKDAGRFVFIDRVKGNPGFLPHVPQSIAYVRRALGRRPELERLAVLLDDLGALDVA